MTRHEAELIARALSAHLSYTQARAICKDLNSAGLTYRFRVESDTRPARQGRCLITPDDYGRSEQRHRRKTHAKD